MSYSPITQENIQSVVDNYLLNGTNYPNRVSDIYTPTLFSQYGPIQGWNTTNITDMSFLFANKCFDNYMLFAVTHISAYGPIHRLGTWNTSNVVNMDSIFLNCTSHYVPGHQSTDYQGNSEDTPSIRATPIIEFDISRYWNVNNVTNMNSMFDGCVIEANGNFSSWTPSIEAIPTNFGQVGVYPTWKKKKITQDNIKSAVIEWCTTPLTATAQYGLISTWDVSGVTDMSGLFMNQSAFNGDISNWTMNQVTDTNQMFAGASAFNQDISGWLTIRVTNMTAMFQGTSNFNQNLNSWPVPLIATEPLNFRTGSLLINENEPLWGIVHPIIPINQENIYPAVQGWCSDDLIATYMYGPINTWDVSGVTDMSGLFWNQLTFNSDISSWEVKNVTNMNLMFALAPLFNQDISGWNVGKVKNMGDMFNDASAFNSDIGKWNTSSVTNMRAMFPRASTFNQDIGTWDTIHVSDMRFMFFGSTLFNQNLNSWSVPLIATEPLRFREQSALLLENEPLWGYEGITQQNIYPAVNEWCDPLTNDATASRYGLISNWRVSRVTDMSGLFYNRTTFTGDISNWNVTNVVNMSSMFKNSLTFNSDISTWNTISVSDMTAMFQGTSNFNQNLNSWPVPEIVGRPADFNTNAILSPENEPLWNIPHPTILITQDNIKSAVTQWCATPLYATYNYGSINEWDVSGVTDMSGLFMYQSTFNDDISKWTMNQVTDTNNMFTNASVFNQDISGWVVGNVVNMSDMFNGASSFNSDISKWTMNQVTDTNKMFANTSVFNQDISGWVVGNVVNMSYMFANASVFNQDISGWEVGNVVNMSNMFNGASSFNSNISAWNTVKVNNMASMFQDTSNFNQNLNSWPVPLFSTRPADFNTNSILPLENEPLWHVMIPITQDNIKSAVTQWCTTPLDASWNYGSINEWNVSGVTDMSGLFMDKFTFNDDISKWTMNQVTDTNKMFGNASVFNQDISGWVVSNVVNMSDMFNGASLFNSNISTWVTFRVSDMTSMFRDTSSFNQNLNPWPVPLIPIEPTDFRTGSLLPYANEPVWGSWGQRIPITQDNIYPAVVQWCNNELIATHLYGHISTWDVSGVTNMNHLFTDQTAFNSDISGWTVTNVTDMNWMFLGATSFNSDISKWNTANVKDMTYMFVSAASFNSDISRWDTHQVTGMNAMFFETASFNRNLNSWPVPLIPERPNDFNFGSALSYSNEPIWGSLGGIRTFVQITQDNIYPAVEQWCSEPAIATYTYGPIWTWDVSGVTDMSGLFMNKTTFNEDIGYWNTINVIDMTQMFQGTTNFNQNLNSWPVQLIPTKPTDFNTDSALISANEPPWGVVYEQITQQNIYIAVNAWCDPVTNAAANIQYGPINNWGVLYVTDMSGLFMNKYDFNDDISRWQVTNVTDMRRMFSSCMSFRQNLNSWNVSNVKNLRRCFQGYYESNSYLRNSIYGGKFGGANPIINGWNVSSVTDMSLMFSSNFRFNGNLSSWDTSKVTDMSQMCISLLLPLELRIESEHGANPIINGWNVSNVVNMNNMFFKNSLFNGDLSLWNTSRVTNMNGMFYDAELINNNQSDLSLWPVFLIKSRPTGNPGLDFSRLYSQNEPNWGHGFLGPGFIDITQQNISSAVNDWYTNPAETISVYGNISIDWNTSTVTNMSGLFLNRDTFNDNITNWNVSNVIDMSGMFCGAALFNQDISATWIVGNVTSMDNMFVGAIDFSQNLHPWLPNSLAPPAGQFSYNTFEPPQWRMNTTVGFPTSGVATKEKIIMVSTYPNWTITSPADPTLVISDSISFTLPDGTYPALSIVVSSTDPLNNIIETKNQTVIIIDTSSPLAPGVTFPDVNPTNNGTVTVVQASDAVSWSYEVSGVLTTVTTGSGSFVLPPGVYAANSISIRNADLAGNDSSPVQNTWVVTIDTSSPLAPVVTFPDVNPTNDGTVSVVQASDAVSWSYEVSGVLTTVTTGSGSFVLPPGVYAANSISIRNADLAGNDSSPVQNTWVVTIIDTSNSPPAPPDVTFPLESSKYIGTVSVVLAQGAVSWSYNISGGTGWSTERTGDGSFNIPWGVYAANSIAVRNIDTTAGNYSISSENQGVITYHEVINQDYIIDAVQAWCIDNANALTKYGNVSTWDVSGVTNMSSLFATETVTNFQGDISGWNVSNVVYMNNMFRDSKSVVDLDLSRWVVDNVIDMSSMFCNTLFNGDIREWNVSKVVNMNGMFKGDASFNQNISTWRPQMVTDLGFMFQDCITFNQDIGLWLNSSENSYAPFVQNMESMFDGATVFDFGCNGSNILISDSNDLNYETLVGPPFWFVENCAEFKYMFRNCTKFNQFITNDANGWKFSGTTWGMFYGATNFQGTIPDNSDMTLMSTMFSQNNNMQGRMVSLLNSSSSYFSGVTDMGRMFEGATKFQGDMSNWNVSNVTDMSYLFNGAVTFNSDISNWNTVNVKNMDYMFNGATSFNQNLSQWSVPLITSEPVGFATNLFLQPVWMWTPSVNFVLSAMNNIITLSTSATIPATTNIITSDATITLSNSVPATVLQDTFFFRTDTDITTDVDYYVDMSKWPDARGTLNPQKGKVTSNGYVADDHVGKDFVRNLAKQLFGTYLGADLFNNEDAVTSDISMNCEVISGNILSLLTSVDMKRGTLNGILVDSSGNKYMNVSTSNRNLGREIFNELVSSTPTRFNDIKNEWAYNVGIEDGFYKMPVKPGDKLMFQLIITPSPDQISAVPTGPTFLAPRSYTVILNIT